MDEAEKTVMTITRALSELKLLKSKYNKMVREFNSVAVQHGSKLRSPYSSYKPEDFEKQVKPGYQSIIDLEKRIIEIKTKIDQSNFITKVKIGSKEMTVLEAIEMKNLIFLKKDLLSKLRVSYRDANSDYEKALSENKAKVDRQVSEAATRDSSGISKADPEIEKRILEQTEFLYGVKLVDPLGLDELIKKLDNEVDEFESNVDFALSESNSTTTIELSY